MSIKKRLALNCEFAQQHTHSQRAWQTHTTRDRARALKVKSDDDAARGSHTANCFFPSRELGGPSARRHLRVSSAGFGPGDRKWRFLALVHANWLPFKKAEAPSQAKRTHAKSAANCSFPPAGPITQ